MPARMLKISKMKEERAESSRSSFALTHSCGQGCPRSMRALVQCTSLVE